MSDLYSSLSEEKESIAVKAVLKNLMEREVLDGAMMEKLALDEGQRRKMFIDPAIIMEARHLQVKCWSQLPQLAWKTWNSQVVVRLLWLPLTAFEGAAE